MITFRSSLTRQWSTRYMWSEILTVTKKILRSFTFTNVYSVKLYSDRKMISWSILRIAIKGEFTNQYLLWLIDRTCTSRLFVCFDFLDPFWKIICTDDTRKTRCQILCSMRLYCVIKTLTPWRMHYNGFQIGQIIQGIFSNWPLPEYVSRWSPPQKKCPDWSPPKS